MTDLLFSPLTDTEVSTRADQADYNLACAVREGRHEGDNWDRDYFGQLLAESRPLHAARMQRTYDHPDGLDGLVAARRAQAVPA